MSNIDTAGLAGLVERLQGALRTQKAFGLTQKGDTCFVTIQRSEIELLAEMVEALGLGAKDTECMRNSRAIDNRCDHRVELVKLRCEWSCTKCKSWGMVKETDLRAKTKRQDRCDRCTKPSGVLVPKEDLLLCEACAPMYRVLACGHLWYMPGWDGSNTCDVCTANGLCAESIQENDLGDSIDHKDASNAGRYVDISAFQPGADLKYRTGGRSGYNSMCHRCGIKPKIPTVVGKQVPDLCHKCASDLGICIKCGIAQKMPDTARGSLFRLCKPCYKRGMGYGVGRK